MSLDNRQETASSDVIARRTLTAIEAGERVALLVFRPEETPGEDPEWECRVELRWSPERTKSLTARGVDSLSALLSALGAARGAFKEDLKSLTRFGVPGSVGLPKLLHDDDPDFLALLEQVIDTEHRRHALIASNKRRRRERREAEKRLSDELAAAGKHSEDET